MNRICPVCERPLKNDDEQVMRHALGKAVWMHYQDCADAWDAQPSPPQRNPSKRGLDKVRDAIKATDERYNDGPTKPIRWAGA